MIIEVKVQKIGNALGVILPDQAVKRLNAEVGNVLILTQAADGGVTLSPKNLKLSALHDLSNRYQNALRELPD